MRKLTSFLMLWLLCLSSSMQAQTTFYKPGERLNTTDEAVKVGSIAPDDADIAKQELSSAIDEATATYNALSAYTRTSTEFITTPTTVLSTLKTAIDAARAALDVAGDTKENYTTAKNTLSKAVVDAQKGFYAQFGDTKFRLKLKDTELYMQVNYPMSNNEGNARLAATSAGNPDQCFSLIAGAGDNKGKYFIQAQGKMLQDFFGWNSQMSSTGTAFTFEPVDLAAGEVKINGTLGYYGIGTDVSPVAGTFIYTNVDAGAKVTWVLEPIAKNDYRKLLEADFTPIQKWHNAYYTKIKDKTSPVFKAYESAYEAARSNADEKNFNKVTSAQIVDSHKALLRDYKAMTDALPEAAGQLFRLQLHSSYHGDNYFMEVINPDLKGVVVTQGPRTVPARTFTFAKQENGSYVIKCGDNPLIYSEGNNYWDVKCATGEASKWQVTPDANVANRFSIRKDDKSYLSPDNTLQEDGSYIVYSNWATANTWELVPVADEDVTDYNEALLQRAEDLYKKYLPYKGVYNALYDKEKENLPGYPQAGSAHFDSSFNMLEEMLVKPSNITKDALDWVKEYLPSVQPVLENYPTNRYFIIHNNDNRGDVYYYNATDADGTTGDGLSAAYLWSTGKSSATPDKGNAAYQWCFLPHEKENGSTEYYLYNVGKKQYARPTKKDDHPGKYCWVFTDEPAPVTLTWRTGHELYITAQSMEDDTPKDVYMSMINNYTGPLTAYTNNNLTDGGLRFTFDWATPTEVDADVTSAVTALVQNDVELTTIGETSLITGLTGEQTTIRTFSSMKAFNVPEGVTAYIATTQIEGSTTFIDLQAVPAEEAVPAQQGVLLIGNKTQATLPVNYRPAESKFDWKANKFLNTADNGEPMTPGCYILAKGEQGIGIYASSTGTLSQGKAYLKLNGSPTSNRLVMRFNGVETSIENLLPALCGEQGAVYDLSGRRVNTVQKGGVYIQNGKKFIYK